MAVTRFLASNLACLCAKDETTLSSVAKTLQMAPSSLLRLAHGETKARLSTLMRLGEYFHIDYVSLGAVDLTAPGALEAATRKPEAASEAAPMALDADDAPVAKPVVAAPPVWERRVPLLTCRQAMELEAADARSAAAIDWLSPLPWGLFSDASLFAVKAPSATMHPSIRQGDYLYLRIARETPFDPNAGVLAEVGSDENLVFSLGTIVAKSSEELLLVGTNPITGTEPRKVRKIVGVVVAVLSIR